MAERRSAARNRRMQIGIEGGDALQIRNRPGAGNEPGAGKRSAEIQPRMWIGDWVTCLGSGFVRRRQEMVCGHCGGAPLIEQ